MDASGAVIQPLNLEAGWFARPSFMPSPQDRLPVTVIRYVLSVSPAFLCYYVMALLVLTPGTRTHRLALLPLGVYAAYKAATTYDIAAGVQHLNYCNYGHCVVMFGITLRMSEWSLVEQPLQRIRSGGKKPNRQWDAADLTCNMRGINWTWSNGLYIPPETRPLNSTSSFLRVTILRGFRDLVVFDTCHCAVQSISPHTFGSTSGGSIFNPDLPFILRYLNSSVITILSGTVIYFSLSMMYHLATLIAFALPGLYQQPSDWPPLSQAPWLSTSLAEFWSKRWHQSFRRSFVQLGGKPLRFLFGRIGGIIGVFLLSGILHDWCIWGMGRGTDFPEIGGFFLLNGVGVILEQVWEQATGRKVEGWLGWLWTMCWMTSTGNLLVDALLRRGLAGGVLVPATMRPGKVLFQGVSKCIR